MNRDTLVDRYPVAVALALIGLCPFIILSTAAFIYEKQIITSLHGSMGGFQLAEALGDAGYAFGAVAAAALISRFALRRLYMAAECLFVAGCLVEALTSSMIPYIVGWAVQGLATGLLLVIALPPLVTRFGAKRLPLSAAIVNVGLFGAATGGPLVGGVVAAASAPRQLELAFAGLGVVGVVLAEVGINADLGRFRQDQKIIQLPIALALSATVLPFVASALLPKTPFTSPAYLGLTTAGVATLAVMMVRQYRLDNPLIPVKLLSTALPVTGTACAMIGGAGFVALDELSATILLEVRHDSPLSAGFSFWPQVVGIVVAAALFAALFRTRFVPVLALSGLAFLAGAGVLLTIADPGAPANGWVVPAAAAMLGFGAGASVSPGLFMAGLGAPSSQIGPAFALVELLRSEAAFIAAPVLLDVATGGVPPPGALTSGLASTGWAIVGMLAGGLCVLGLLFVASGARLRRPDLENWIDQGGQALHSPQLAEPLRRSA